MNNPDTLYGLLFNLAGCAAVAIFAYMIGDIFFDYWRKTKKTYAEIIAWICLGMIYLSAGAAFVMIFEALKRI